MEKGAAEKNGGFFDKMIKAAVKGAKTAATKFSTAYKKTKKRIEDSIDDYKAKKELRRKAEIEEYSAFVGKTIKKIKDGDVRDFINYLGASPNPLTFKSSERIKTTFPIPCEQRVIWAYYSDEKTARTRSGGLVVTEKGVFVKPVAHVFKKKASNEKDANTSELFYYPWLLMDSFSDEHLLKQIVSPFETENVNSFVRAWNRFNEKQRDSKVTSANYYSSNSTVQKADSLIVSGMLLNHEQVFVRNNGYGNNPNAGHGLFAERANNMADRLCFKNAKIVGGNNAKNGPDRLVNGINIQTKYYRTGARSVGAAFDNKETGNYRYWNADGTPMKLEVPKGQRFDAVRAMRNKIAQGKVKTEIGGQEYAVTDPNEAENIIVEGHYSYAQSVNMAKAGTIESLLYDVKTGAVVTSCVFGISFLINSYLCYRKIGDKKEAVVTGLLAGGKVGALTLGTHVLISQLARTKTFSTIMKKNFGAVAAVVGIAVFSIPETYDLAMKRISAAQFAGNLTVLSASVIGCAVGGSAGAALGGPAGALVGGSVVGTTAAVGASRIVGVFRESDEKRLARLFNAISAVMVTEYFLDESEIDVFIAKMNAVSDRKFSNLFKDIQSSQKQEKTIRSFLRPYFRKIIKKREKYEPDFKLLTAAA